MPSINKLKKEIEILKDKIVNPNFDRNWKHNDPHWKYDIMFSDWLLFEYYRNKVYNYSANLLNEVKL